MAQVVCNPEVKNPSQSQAGGRAFSGRVRLKVEPLGYVTGEKDKKDEKKRNGDVLG